MGFGTPGPLAAAHKRGGSLIPMLQTPSAYGSAIPTNKLGVIKEIEVSKPHIHLSKEVRQKLMDLNQSDNQATRRGGLGLSTMKDSLRKSIDNGSVLGDKSIEGPSGGHNLGPQSYIVKAGQRFLRRALVQT